MRSARQVLRRACRVGTSDLTATKLRLISTATSPSDHQRHLVFAAGQGESCESSARVLSNSKVQLLARPDILHLSSTSR
jgi:hypothetical protein